MKGRGGRQLLHMPYAAGVLVHLDMYDPKIFQLQAHIRLRLRLHLSLHLRLRLSLTATPTLPLTPQAGDTTLDLQAETAMVRNVLTLLVRDANPNPSPSPNPNRTPYPEPEPEPEPYTPTLTLTTHPTLGARLRQGRARHGRGRAVGGQQERA